jgi:DNA-3-methyladenine glycosylase
VVTRPAGVPEAVLIRALDPLDGLDLMRSRRRLADAPAWRLCRGPGALCQALGVTRQQNGADLVRGPLRILDAPPVDARRVRRSTRIGVAYAGADALRPWRFLVSATPAVSGPRSLAR